MHCKSCKENKVHKSKNSFDRFYLCFHNDNYSGGRSYMLTLENLSLFYEQDKKVLDDINLIVADGECVLLTGESGSGKSSIINSINGIAF